MSGRRIAIVGSGQAGLILAFAMLEQGWVVTLFSDRTPDELYNGRATATAFMFDRALGRERKLGLNLWDDFVPWSEGIHLDFCSDARVAPLTLEGRFTVPGQAVDQRLKYSVWLREFVRRGGVLEVAAVMPTDLETLAARHDLVCVAAGRGALANLFKRDEQRSTYREPRRTLALLTLAGVGPWPEIELENPAKFSFLAGEGELFWIPFFDRSEVACYSLLFEARPGGLLDRFRDAADGPAMIRAAKATIAELFPWDERAVRDVRLTDPLAWAKGEITPAVRRPAATLRSGRAVMAIGDTVILNDPIAGQGSNSATKLSYFLGRRIAAHEGPFEREWIEAQFEAFWESDGRHITAFSNLFLEPLQPAARELLLAGSRHSGICDWLCDCFNAPEAGTRCLFDLQEAAAADRG